MAARVQGLVALLLVASCGLAHAYLYNYCQAPLPRYIPPPLSNVQLVQVSVFTRHGDRSPTQALPQENVEWICGATDEVELAGGSLPSIGPLKRNIFIDENSPFSFELWSGNCTVGQLTSKGATQSYLLGQQLRSIYISTLHFIPTTFDPTLVFIRSTDVWRTQQSAEANLLGLYPLSSRNGAVPVINIAPTNVETMWSNTEACPILNEAIYNLTISPEFVANEAEFEPLLIKLNRVCNTTNYFGVNSSWTVLDFFDNLQARTCHNLPLPCNAGECVNKTDVAEVGKAGNFQFPYLLGGAVQNRLGTGFFMAEVLNHIQAVLNGSSTQRYAYYSGHDSTLAAILDAWNVTDWQWPPYASNILLETWRSKSGSDVYVRMIYNGDLISFPYCKNAQFCTWAELYGYYEEYLKPDVSLCFASSL